MGKRFQFLCIFLFAAMVTACTPLATDYRVEGFKLTQQAFDSFQDTPDLHRVIVLENVKIHIVGSRQLFQWEKAAAQGSSTIGYASSNNEIFLLGKRVGDRIIVNQAVLGHELSHLLHFKDLEIADPDGLDRLEQRHFGDPLSSWFVQYLPENGKAR